MLVLALVACGPTGGSRDAADAGDAALAGDTSGAGSVDAGLVDTRDAGSVVPGDDAGDAGPVDPGDAGSVDTGDAGSVDAGSVDTGADAGVAPWRTSLHRCWNDASCARVMAVGHGGAWDTSSAPYDSNAALQAAFDGDVDGVKIDVRVTADDVPVISHSSPLEIYESLDCYNRRIEEMTADEVTACHRVPSHTETFQRLDDVLDWLRGKMVVQLCVKRSQDYQRTIDEVHAQHAEDYAFIEISPDEMVNQVPTLDDAGDIYFLINAASDLSAVDSVLALNDPRAFMIEFNPTVDLGDLVTTRLHPAGVRAFTYDDGSIVTKAQLEAHFDAGFDVVSANAALRDVEARVDANQARGVTPP